MQLAILNSGLVTSVGLTAPATCAAIRTKLSNPTQTRFMDASGEWIMAHQVTLDQPWRGLDKLAQMAVRSIDECLVNVPAADWPSIPLLLCVAESDRAGRPNGLEDTLLQTIEQELQVRFSPHSAVVPHGRVSTAFALRHARQLLSEGAAKQVLIVAVDSLVNWPMLQAYDNAQRLLTAANSNGFMPGEGAGALLVSPSDSQLQLRCTGLGFSTEPAPIDSTEPLRGNGLAGAIKGALGEARCEIQDLDFRIVDVSGEQYYFKEAALAIGRTLRVRKAEFDIWHPAECVGELGAVAGCVLLAVAQAACIKGYAPGPGILVHLGNDSGERAALVMQFAGDGP
jgi:3-oxoacyl-[acyl-carrier-protein] synthase-1